MFASCVICARGTPMRRSNV